MPKLKYNLTCLPVSGMWGILAVFVLMSSGCDGFFGSKTDTSFIDAPVFDDNTVAYVPILPVLDGFVRPVDVIAGWDELIYVADAGTEEIISFDQAGNELEKDDGPWIGFHCPGQKIGYPGNWN